MADSLTGLNEPQRRAVEAGDGPIVVIAGPGTGKTNTLTARIAYLLHTHRAKPAEILALTFTKKAAEEMHSRLTTLLGSKQAPNVTTFHGLCYELLQSDAAFVAESERLQLVASLTRPVGLKHLSVREMGLEISKAKNSLEPQHTDIAKIVTAYNKVLHAKNLRDFDDLLLDAYELLRSSVTSQPYKYIFVDEFQDTNRLQYEILKSLRVNDNIFVIGDPNQSIYGFRGASGTILEQFKTDFPMHMQVILTTNYRSAPEIVRLSNAIFPKQKALQPADITTKGEVRAVQVLNEYSEAQWIISEIQRAIGGGDFLRAVSDDDCATHCTLRDFAILYRSRTAARALQKVVDESGLPYQIVGEGSPYERPYIQMLIDLMRASADGQLLHLEKFSTTQNRHITELLKEYVNRSPLDFVAQSIRVLDIASNKELAQFNAVLSRFTTIKEAVRYFDNIAENGFYDPRADAITLLTIHASKGLEFPRVFLIGTQEGILPSDRGDRTEEHRLFYVAATRAKERLEILHSKNRGGQPAVESSFLRSLPSSVMERVVDPDMQNQARRIAQRQAKRSQQSLF